MTASCTSTYDLKNEALSTTVNDGERLTLAKRFRSLRRQNRETTERLDMAARAVRDLRRQLAEEKKLRERLEEAVRKEAPRKVWLREGKEPDPDRLRRAVDKAVAERQVSSPHFREFLTATMPLEEVNEWLHDEDKLEQEEAWRVETQRRFLERQAVFRAAGDAERARVEALTPEQREAEGKKWAALVARLDATSVAREKVKREAAAEREAARVAHVKKLREVEAELHEHMKKQPYHPWINPGGVKVDDFGGEDFPSQERSEA
jgi:hypothetical protein